MANKTALISLEGLELSRIWSFLTHQLTEIRYLYWFALKVPKSSGLV